MLTLRPDTREHFGVTVALQNACNTAEMLVGIQFYSTRVFSSVVFTPMEQFELCTLLHWSVLFTSFYYMIKAGERQGIILGLQRIDNAKINEYVNGLESVKVQVR